jgi:Uncharacterised protein family (UPF0158)
MIAAAQSLTGRRRRQRAFVGMRDAICSPIHSIDHESASMAETRTVCVKASELREAFEFVSCGAPFEHEAHISLDTGKIYWTSSAIDMEEEKAPPGDIADEDRYLAVPHKNDLEPGRRLALAFVGQYMSHDYETAEEFFHSKGAYGRFKALLHRRDRLQQWYEFEREATQKALLVWCEANNVQLVDEAAGR